jgi:hypothetical protein
MTPNWCGMSPQNDYNYAQFVSNHKDTPEKLQITVLLGTIIKTLRNYSDTSLG